MPRVIEVTTSASSGTPQRARTPLPSPDAAGEWSAVSTPSCITVSRARIHSGNWAAWKRVGQRARLAVEKSKEHGHDLTGAALASDAFFPFADGPELALDAGVSSIIQPGGSKRDDEVAEAIEAAGAVMVFTGRRHFRH